MKTVKMKRQFAKSVQQGNPLMIAKDLLGDYAFSDGEIIRLIDGDTKAFVAYAIIAKQNRALGWILSQDETMTFNIEFMRRLFTEAYRMRQTHPVTSNAYRLFNGESDGLGGLTVDWYNKVAVVSFYSQGLYSYQAMIIEALQQSLPDCIAIYEKLRFPQASQQTQLVWGTPTDRVEIVENGVNYATYMNDGLMTGIFLDQRDVRAYIKEHARHQSVLNTFSYTGAFSVAAASGGATSTVSVDVANRSIEKTTEQFALNGITDLTHHQLYVMDVFDYFKYAKKHGKQFDWVILDPPSFARTKKRTFSVAKDYTALIQDALGIVSDRGHLVLSTNAANVSDKQFHAMIDAAFSREKKSYRIDAVYRLPSDFKTLSQLAETNYLKVYIVSLT